MLIFHHPQAAYCHKIEQNKITVSWIVWLLNRLTIYPYSLEMPK